MSLPYSWGSCLTSPLFLLTLWNNFCLGNVMSSGFILLPFIGATTIGRRPIHSALKFCLYPRNVVGLVRFSIKSSCGFSHSIQGWITPTILPCTSTVVIVNFQYSLVRGEYFEPKTINSFWWRRNWFSISPKSWPTDSMLAVSITHRPSFVSETAARKWPPWFRYGNLFPILGLKDTIPTASLGISIRNMSPELSLRFHVPISIDLPLFASNGSLTTLQITLGSSARNLRHACADYTLLSKVQPLILRHITVLEICRESGWGRVKFSPAIPDIPLILYPTSVTSFCLFLRFY